MLTKGETYKALNEFKQYVINQSIAMLSKKGKNASGKLAKSIDADLKVHKQSFSLKFLMADYADYVDQGVSGTQKKYDTPYAYKDKMPPPSALDKWTVRRKIAPRDDNGKFLPRKSINYLIAKSIFEKGLKPSLFFTQPFQNAYKNLPKQLSEAFALDVENFMIFTTNKILK